jgi:hypothetical protein
MKPLSRRNFLHGMGSLLALSVLRLEGPELILYNGNIWTVDETQPQAQALAISDARFLAVGSNEDVLRLATARNSSSGRPPHPPWGPANSGGSPHPLR